MPHLWNWLTRWRRPKKRQRPVVHGRPRTRRVQLECECLEDRTLLSGTPVLGTGTGLLATYYSNVSLTGTPAVSQVSSLVDFSSSTGAAPVAGLPATNWSAAWTGSVQPASTGTYTFNTTSDGGIRVFVNGAEIINNWTAHAATTNTGSISLVAGQQYAIEVEYFQTTGPASVVLRLVGAQYAEAVIPKASLYPTPLSGAGAAPTGQLSAANVTAGGTTYSFTVTYQDAAGINVASLGSNDVSVTGPDGFSQLAALGSVSGSANGTIVTATYNITPPGGSWTSADNGTYSVALLAGQVAGATGTFAGATTLGTFQATLAAAAAATGTGLIGTYYSNVNLSGTPVVTQISPLVDFSTSTGAAPVSGLPATNWSAEWSGTVQPPTTGTYTFNTTSDSGIRVFVNGVEIINNWTSHSSTTNSGTISLVAGLQYAIQVEYFQTTGPASVVLRWSGPGTPEAVIPKASLYPTPISGSSPAPTGQLSAATVTAAGGTTYTFTVTYQDAAGINVSTIGSNDISVTGPGGFSQLATLVSESGATGSTVVAATYGITPAGGLWTSADNGTYSVALLAGQVAGTTGALAAASTLGSFQAAVSDWFSQNLHDPALVSLAQSLYYAANRQLNYNGMLSIFTAVEKSSTVSATDLGDLRTLVANAGQLGMPAAVQSLANAVVNGDPANATYLGKALGNLAAGSSATVLTDLVNTWFLGLNYPTTVGGLTYVYAAGTLFGSGGPVYTDIVQGDVGDCYFMASLAELAYRDPSAITNMFTDNGNGTYTVRFYDAGVATYVTVNRYLPATSGGNYFYANQGEALSGASNVLWAALAEKAYAELAASGWSKPTVADAYSAITTGWEGTAIYQEANISANSQALTNSSATTTALLNALAAGQMIGLDSNTTTASPIIADHVYVLLSYNATTQTYLTYNPWGYTQTLTWAQIAANFSNWSNAAV